MHNTKYTYEITLEQAAAMHNRKHNTVYVVNKTGARVAKGVGPENWSKPSTYFVKAEHINNIPGST